MQMFEWVAEGGVEVGLTQKFTDEKNRPTITTANLIEDLSGTDRAPGLSPQRDADNNKEM